MTDDEELAAITERLRSRHDVLPFLGGLHPIGQMQAQPMPAEMQALLQSSPDYLSPAPGSGPVWLQICAGSEQIELVVCRAGGSRRLFVFAPGKD